MCKVSEVTGGGKTEKSYTITWTNSSLPAHPCPREAIDRLYNKLADASGRKRSHASSSSHHQPLISEPSRTLRKVLGQEFRVKSVGLKFDVSCGSNVQTATESSKQYGVPILRNEIDLIRVTLGSVFRYKVPRETFYSPKGGDTRELDLSLLTINGTTLPPDGPIGFDTVNQEIFSLALEPSASNGIITSITAMKLRPKILQPEEYMIVARDIETGGIAAEAFVVEYIREGDSYVGQSRSDYKRPDTFEVTMTLAPSTNSELDLETRVNLMYRLATSVLSDSDPDAIKVITWKRGKYITNYHDSPQSAGNQGALSGSSSNSRTKRENRDWSIPDSEEHHATFYEIVWTNKSLQNLEACPAEAINDNIINPIFKRKSIEDISRSFEPDFSLLHIAFRPVGSCVNYLQNHRLGDEPVAVFLLNPTSTTQRTPVVTDEETDESQEGSSNNKINPILSRPSEDASFDESDREYYMTSILPALITITIMLIVALIIVCVLVRYRRSQEKTRFEVTTGIVSGLSSGHLASGLRTPGGGDHWSAEREAFLGKGGRAPVIFEQEMQQQQALLANQAAVQSPYGFTYAPVMMPPPPPVAGHPSTGHYGMIGAVPTVQHHQIHQVRTRL